MAFYYQVSYVIKVGCDDALLIRANTTRMLDEAKVSPGTLQSLRIAAVPRSVALRLRGEVGQH